MKEDSAYGVIVFYAENSSIWYLVVKQVQGHWSFPKGHAEKGETKLETAVRELEEETGIKNADLISDGIEVTDEYTIKPGTEKETHKVVEFFIGQADSKDVKMQEGEIYDHKWITTEEGNELLTFDSSKRILRIADEIVQNYLQKKTNI